MMLEDEVDLVVGFLVADAADFVVESPPTCGLHTCRGHTTQAEAEAVHDAIDSCYAATRD